MNKKHWNMISIDNSLNRNQLKELIDHSYELVVKGLSKTQKKTMKPITQIAKIIEAHKSKMISDIKLNIQS